MSAVSSSSTSRPIETTRTTPSPMRRSIGVICLRPSCATPARRPSTPSMRGTENPQMSASRTPTVRPCAASAAARLTVTDDLPTPPLPEAMRITLAASGTEVSSGRWETLNRALPIAVVRCSSVISVQARRTEVTPGSEPTRARTSCWIWARSGQPAVVRAIVTTTAPSAPTSAPRAMPRSTMSLPSSGSMTPRSTARTSSLVGRARVRGSTSTAGFYRRGPVKPGPAIGYGP